MRTVLTCCAVLALAGCSRRPQASVRVDPALAMLVPADTVMLAGAKFDSIRATPVFQKFVASNPFLEEFSRTSGIDARKDLWELLVASNGKDAVGLARGKFTPDGALEPKLNLPGARRFPYKGYTLIGSEEAAVVFLNATTALTGRTAALRSVLDQRAGGIPRPLLDLIQSIPGTSQLWGAAIGGSAFLSNVPLPGNWANLNRLFASVQTATLSVDLRTGLDFTMNTVCATEQDAKQLHDAARALIGLGRLNTPDNQSDLLRFYDCFKVEHHQRQANLTAQIPMDLLEKFAASVGAR